MDGSRVQVVAGGSADLDDRTDFHRNKWLQVSTKIDARAVSFFFFFFENCSTLPHEHGVAVVL